MSKKNFISPESVAAMFPPRDRLAHKGNFGHAFMAAGKQGMMGAAILATGAALRSGCGLVTVHVPFSERLAVQISHPSAILSLDSHPYFSELPESLSKYSAAGVGPGLGQAPETAAALESLLKYGLPTVIDADALNIIASHPDFFALIPAGSILTPHAGELRRLLYSAVSNGVISGFHVSEISDPAKSDIWRSEDERNEMVMALSADTGAVIVAKGAGTMVCQPSGNAVFNPAGNPGMAKGGSGDVLTGLITGFLARGFSAENAAVAGVYLHGLAGDRAAAAIGEESMNASDILSFLSCRV